MLTIIQSIILGGLQGISELFPISSLGHSIILPRILGWAIDEQSEYFLIFLVATHLATAIVLFLFYWKDWMRIINGIFRSLSRRRLESDVDAKVGWLLIVGTIPAGLIGLVFEHKIRELFITPESAALFLICNGILLFAAEYLRRKAPIVGEGSSDSRIARLSWGQGLLVGLMQVHALIPGFSRTAASFSGGLWVGLSHTDALRFSFLLATPIIGAAAVLKLPQLFHASSSVILITIIGAVSAGIFAFISVKFLTRYFKAEKHTLIPFAIYCLVVGTAVTIYLF